MLGGARVALQVTPERTSYLAGEEVRVAVALAVEDDRPLAVQEGRVDLLYVNRYNYRPENRATLATSAARDEVVVASACFLDDVRLPGRASSTHTIALALPERLPASGAGAQTSVEWKVRATVALRHARDARHEESLTMFTPVTSYREWGEQEPQCNSPDCVLTFQLASRHVYVGGHVQGTLLVEPEVDGAAQAVRVELVKREIVWRGQQLVDDWVQAEAVVAGDVVLEAGVPREFPFDLIVPDGLPPSLETPQTALHWLLRGVVDLPLRPDYRVLQELTIYNGGIPDE